MSPFPAQKDRTPIYLFGFFPLLLKTIALFFQRDQIRHAASLDAVAAAKNRKRKEGLSFLQNKGPEVMFSQERH